MSCFEAIGAKVAPRASVSAEGPLSAAARGAAGVDRRFPLQPELPRPPHGARLARGARTSCARWSAGSCHSSLTAASRCGRCGSPRAWRTVAGRSSPRPITAWSTASPPPTCSRCCSTTSASPRRPASARWTPKPEPSASELVAQPLARRLMTPVDAVGAVRSVLQAPKQIAGLAMATVKGTAAMRGLLRPTPRSSLNGPIGPHRRWHWAHAQLSDVKVVRERARRDRQRRGADGDQRRLP